MGALVLGTASGVVILLTALSMGLPVAAAIAAQSVGGIGATLGAALVQTVLAARREREEIFEPALEPARAGVRASRAELRTQSA